MTYEEFHALAVHPHRPQDIDSFFELKAYMPAYLPDRKRQHYPQYQLWATQTAFFHTIEEAEEAIVVLVRDNLMEDPDDKYHSFMVTERQFSTLNHLDSGVLSWHLYDGDGKLSLQSLAASCHCDVDDAYKKFRGRTEDTIKFKKGDIVEVVDYARREVSLAVVSATSPDIDWCWDYRKRLLKSRFFDGDLDSDEDTEALYGLEAMADFYNVVFGPRLTSYDHLPSYSISSPRYPVPPYMQKKLQCNYQRHLEKCAECEKDNGKV